MLLSREEDCVGAEPPPPPLPPMGLGELLMMLKRDDSVVRGGMGAPRAVFSLDPGGRREEREAAAAGDERGVSSPATAKFRTSRRISLAKVMRGELMAMTSRSSRRTESS